MAQPGPFPHPPPPQLTSADSAYNQAQTAPPMWPGSQPSDSRLLAPTYPDIQQSTTPPGYTLSPQTPSPTSDGWQESQSVSGMPSQIDVTPGPSSDTKRRGLAALADAPENNTGHPGYAIKVLAEFAIKGSATGRMSLNDIYLAVEERYPGFRSEWGTNWRNSARHDISMDPRFIKVDRRPDEPGRGGLWTFNPNVPPKPPIKRSSRSARTNNSVNASRSSSNSQAKEGTSHAAGDWSDE
ncbi:hypothetical protein FRB96_000512 [Tulasnella sp. 330]|nr:hypothetical protein FRB96_000512 [Tulasnella sp. 330]KAG8888183.1 hypothetical protein FRB98_008201 [Tulasnella sp. 332]